MKIKVNQIAEYDTELDSLYIKIREDVKPVATMPINKYTLFDFDINGSVIGIELLAYSKYVAPSPPVDEDKLRLEQWQQSGKPIKLETETDF